MVSFNICIDETGTQSVDILSAIRRVIRHSLELHPEHEKLIRQSMVCSLPLPHVMGPAYRYLWVDKIGASFFIIIATHCEGGGRGKPVLVWAIRRKVGDTLKDICMDTILGRLRVKMEVEKLGLPTILQRDLMAAFDT
eukprot:GFUD01003729.1.p1 GENE.GFUD01003729.1~~GFUD01003729.1.p1  ORF type:complete len:138 (-),score=31.37 GFUD01003729.1:39-452(-)